MLKLNKTVKIVNNTEITLDYEKAMLVDEFLHHIERSNRLDGVKIAGLLDKTLRKYANEVSMEIHEPKVNKKVKEWFILADEMTDKSPKKQNKLPL